MNLNFKTINPANVRTGGFFFEINLQASQVPGSVRRVLYIGQHLAGSAVPNTLTQFFDYEDMVGFAGEGSMLAEMARYGVAAAKFYGAATERWFLAVDDNGAGAAATGTITITGAATANGTLALYIAGTPVPVAVTTGDAVATVATNIAAAVNAIGTLPVTAAAALGVVTLTCRWKGVTGNDIDVRTNYEANDDVTPAGIAAACTAITGGTQNPSLVAAIAAMGDQWFTDIVMPCTDATNLTALQTELQSRWGASRQIDGTSWSGYRGTVSAADTFGDAQNSPFSQFIAMGSSPLPGYIMAAIVAEVASQSLENDPALPLSTLQLPGALAPAASDRFTWEEENLLLHNGMSTLTYDNAGNVFIGQMITSYQKNANNIADTSYLYTEDVAAASRVRFVVNAKMSEKFPRYKFSPTEIPVQPGQLIATPMRVRGVLAEALQDCQDAGLIIDAQSASKDAAIGPVQGNDSACEIGFQATQIRGLRGIFTQGNLVN